MREALRNRNILPRCTEGEKEVYNMALTRSQVKEWLSEAGAADDKIGGVIDKIFAGHSSTVDALKEERDNYKTEADKIKDLQKQLDDANLSIKDGEGWKDKYEALVKQQANTTKRAALETALRNAKVNDTVIKLMLDKSDLDSVEMDGGKLKDEEAALKPFRDNYGGLFGIEETKPTNQPTPPTGGGQSGEQDPNKMTFAEYKKWYAAQHKTE